MSPSAGVLLVLLARQRLAPRLARAVALVALSIAVWFIHLHAIESLILR